MIVIDTSVWVDLLRDRRTAAASTLEALIERRADIAITETVLMEVLAGAPSGERVVAARRRLHGMPILRLEGLLDFEEAAQIYRACRDAGETVRSQLDCLIAVPTIRHGASLLHNDRDFEKIARHTALRIEPIDQRRPPEDGRHVRERKRRWRRGAQRRPERAPA